MAGQHTLDETERQVQARLGDLKIDFEAMAVTSNLFRPQTLYAITLSARFLLNTNCLGLHL